MKWDGLLTDIQLFFLQRKFARDLTCFIYCTCVFSGIFLLALGFVIPIVYCLSRKIWVWDCLCRFLSVSCTQLRFAGSGYNVPTFGLGCWCQFPSFTLFTTFNVDGYVHDSVVYLLYLHTSMWGWTLEGVLVLMRFSMNAHGSSGGFERIHV